MALNKYATIRYRVIDRSIRSKSRPFPSKESLRQACEEELFGSISGEHISISTIEKDLWALKNESSLGYAPIAYDKTRNGYYYSDPEFSLDLPLNEEDIELIRMATRTLRQFKDSRIFQDLESAIGKIESRLNVYNHMERAQQREWIRFETAPWYAGSEHLAVLLDAIRSQKEICFDYTPFVHDDSRTFTVHPYFLQEHKNRWYLICFETAGEKFRTLGLDRLQHISETGRSFMIRNEFHPENYYQYSFGIGIYDGKPQEVELQFHPVQGKYIKSQPIHHTQVIISDTATALRVKLTVIISPEFIMHLLSYGSAMQVISPPDLSDELKNELEKAARQYS